MPGYSELKGLPIAAVREIYQIELSSLLQHAVVEVGLFPANLTVNENETFPVCARITNGVLGRDVIIPLVVESGSAVGETYYQFL